MTATSATASTTTALGARRGWKRWLGAAGALARRDFIVEWSYQFQLILRFVQVIVLTAVLFFVAKLVNNPVELQPYGGNYFEFTVIGFVVGAFGATSLSSFGDAIATEQRLGTLESLLVSAAPVSAILGGSLVVPFVITLVQIVAYLAVAILIFGAHIRLAGVPLAIPVLGLTILTFCALGVISAAFIILTKRGDPVTLFAAQSSAFLAGALFPTTLLPGVLEAFTRLIPAYWGMEAMRRLLLTDAGWNDVKGPIFVLCLFVIVMVPSSFAILRWALRSARRTGTLGTY